MPTTARMPARAKMLAKVRKSDKPCREANFSRDASISDR
jgi:hypothetical protein